MESKEIKFAFFGTPQVSVDVLDILEKEDLLPSLAITSPDKPKGRGLNLQPSAVKLWAKERNIRVLTPQKIDEAFIKELGSKEWDVFVVVAYGKILPKDLLNIPKKASINLHYSLLPELRGPAPVEGAILTDTNPTGVTTILMDEKMDHGPILMQKEVFFKGWPVSKSEMFKELNLVGGRLLADTIIGWLAGGIKERKQEHEKATFVKMIKKEDALIDLGADPYSNYLKILAYEKNPKPFFLKDGKRIVINKAEFKDGELKILRITPEGKKEQDYRDF